MTRSQFLKIRRFVIKEMKKCRDPQHDFVHVDRVRRNALRIVELLNLQDMIDHNLLEAICLLHDLTYTAHSPNLLTWFLERRLVKRRLRHVFLTDGFDLTREDHITLTIAIVHHPHSFPLRRLNRQRSLYAQILQDADTLDFYSEERVATFYSLSRQLFLFYRFSTLFVGVFRRLYFRNIHKYLNFPQLAGHFLEER